jgi:outer membrane protein TolC
LQFHWNIFDGGADYAEQKQTALAAQRTELELKQLEIQAPAQLEEAKKHFRLSVMSYSTKQSSIKKAEEAVRLARSGLTAGTRTNTEVLDAVVDLNKARAALVKSQIEAIEALGELQLLAGEKVN